MLHSKARPLPGFIFGSAMFRIFPQLLLCLLWSPISQSEVVTPTSDFSQAEAGEHLPAGAISSKHRNNRLSFSKPVTNLNLHETLDFEVGKAIFEKLWVFSPSSTTASDGLGPLYNARSCERCHQGNGRGNLLSLTEQKAQYAAPVPLIFRLNRPSDGSSNDEQQRRLQGSIADPTYGFQLQTFAWPGGPAEARVSIEYDIIEQPLNGEPAAMLRKPRYTVNNLGYGEMHPETQLSPRLAPPSIGLGLIAAIDERDLQHLADPDDSNGDGISGRLNRVWDPISESEQIGRFGWKASTATLVQQNLSALSTDIGINSWLFPNPHGDCTAAQTNCLQQPSGNTDNQDQLEAANAVANVLNYYVEHLSVPTRYSANQPEVLEGKRLFYQAGCADCHQPAFVTGEADNPKLAHQQIWPYSDFLLHDMGEGLAEELNVFYASGREWRTPPLWGLGLTKTVSGSTHFLHDGRAGSLLEAILWHGGEAATAQQAVVDMTPEERSQLITFLESL